MFADTCARCHSSKGPRPPPELALDPDQCAGEKYPACFKRYWDWTQTDAFKAQMRDIVQAPDFLQGNYLSTEARIPVTLLRTNACSPLGTNALAGNIWDNFSSQSYKQLPSVGTITVHDPFTGEAGALRHARRWPRLHARSVLDQHLVAGAVAAQQQRGSVRHRSVGGGACQGVRRVDRAVVVAGQARARSILGNKVPGTIDRTTQRSSITIPVGFVPEVLQPMQGWLHRWLPWLVSEGGDVVLGPIPKDVPVNLISNLKLRAESDDLSDKVAQVKDLAGLLIKLKKDLATAPANASDEELREKFANLRKPMLALSKCPDFVVNRGHYFGTDEFNQQDGLSADEKAFGTEPVLSDADKRALIAFIKTF